MAEPAQALHRLPVPEAAAPSPGPPVSEPRRADPVAELREILLGGEIRKIAALEHRLDDTGIRAREVSEVLSGAVAAGEASGVELGQALTPAVEQSIGASIRSDPQVLARTLSPVIGPAIRKYVAQALREMVESLNQVLDRSLSVRSWRWRFEAWRSGRSFAEIALSRSLLYRVEQILLIHRRTGLLLYQVAEPIAAPQRADLVAAMLTAIGDFSRDAFRPESFASLESIRMGELSIWIEERSELALAAVVLGDPPAELRHRIQQCADDLESRFAGPLSSFQGGTAAFEDAHEPLKACMVSQRREPAPIGSAALVAVAVGILAAAAAFGYIRLRDNARWANYLARLKATPGILLISSTAGGGAYTLAGFRDPFAPDPGALLAESELDPVRVNATWQPYESEHPRFRAIRRRARIESYAVHFEPGGSAISPAQRDMLAPVATEIRKLLDDAQATGRRVRIEAAGHTDDVGSEAENRRLGLRRAEAVVATLTRFGLAKEILSAADSPPPPAGTADPETRAAGRRVRFVIHFTPELQAR